MTASAGTVSEKCWRFVFREARMADIIVLDDVSDAGILIKRILERQGHKVQVFTGEESAIRHVAKKHVDLAILDMKLEKMTGIEVLSRMKQARPELKAIMLTGYPSLETARDSLQLGASAYCVKPIDKEELEMKTAEVLRENAS